MIPMDNFIEIIAEPFTQDLQNYINKGFSQNAHTRLGENCNFDTYAFIAKDTEGCFVGTVVVQQIW